jgi:hypothetical protein
MDQARVRLQEDLGTMVESYIQEAARALNIPYGLRPDYDEIVQPYSFGRDLATLTMDNLSTVVQQVLELFGPYFTHNLQCDQVKRPIVSVVCLGFGLRFIPGSNETRVWIDVNVGLTH